MSIKDRAENIKKHVKLLDVMRDAGHLDDSTKGDDFQLRCPFHGKDNKASAHVYPDGHFHCFACGRNFDVIAYYAEVANISVANAFYMIERKYNVPRLKGDTPANYEKLGNDKPKTFSLKDEFVQVEALIVQNKFKYGREKFARMLFVLDDALKNGKAENFAKLREKL